MLETVETLTTHVPAPPGQREVDLKRARLSSPAFREDYRLNYPVSSAGMVADIFATNVVVLAAMAGLAWGLSSVAGAEWANLPLAFLYASLIEYLVHRYVMHGKRRVLYRAFRRHVLQHHVFHTAEHMGSTRVTDMRLVFFPTLNMLGFVAAVLVPHVWCFTHVWSANAGRLFGISALFFFLNFEWLHFAYHVDERSWILRIPGVRWLRGVHQVHHQKPLMGQVNFNIAYPIFDVLFGTLRSPTKEVPCPPHQPR